MFPLQKTRDFGVEKTSSPELMVRFSWKSLKGHRYGLLRCVGWEVLERRKLRCDMPTPVVQSMMLFSGSLRTIRLLSRRAFGMLQGPLVLLNNILKLMTIR